MVSTFVVLLLTSGSAAARVATNVESDDPLEELDAATREALELENRITDLAAERIALDTRLDVLDERIAAQAARLEEARTELKAARGVYGRRVVAIYKSGPSTPIAMLLESQSFQDFLSRSTLLTRIAAQDRELWEYTARCASEEHFQAQQLEDLRTQEKELQRINESRRRTLERSLERQERLIQQLSEEAEAYLAALRQQEAKTRQEWEDSSIPDDTVIEFAPAIVEPYFDRTYLVPVHQPLRYETTGRSFTAVCSWYGPGFHGRRTASGQTFNEEDFTCASRTLAFGTRLALTRGERRIIVVVTDRGPFISGRDLDLSKAAARALGFGGVEPVHAEFVTPLEASQPEGT